MNLKNLVMFQTQELTKEEKIAIRALSTGEANEGQQVLALAVIVNKLSRANELAYIPDSFDQSAFLAGRSFVGKNIQLITNNPIEED